jgi:hypothetical protein
MTAHTWRPPTADPWRGASAERVNIEDDE